MGALAALDKVTPLIVCGAARSGTAMVKDILNAHPAVAVQDEMHAQTLEAYFTLLSTVQATFDHYSERKGRRLDDHWRRSQAALHHGFFAAANKRRDATRQKTDLRFHGIKTPGFERYFKDFEAMFPRRKPHYIYCMRDIGKVWRSWRTREFTNDLDVFSRRYERSLRQAIKIKREAGSRFALFDLDAFIKSESPDDYVLSTLYGPLGLEAPDGFSVAAIGNTNSAAAMGLELVQDDDLPRQIDYLRGLPNVKTYKDRLAA